VAVKATKRAASGATAPNDRTRAPSKARKASPARNDTRKKLLDAAERLFAEQGYDGTSLRDIADMSKQHLALSTYHFGTKEKLFAEVIQRRAEVMTDIRIAALEEIDVASMSQSDAVRALIEAYALPMIRARYGSSVQWQAHVRLVSQLISVKRWLPLIRANYDTCGRAFIAKFREVLPDADNDALLNAFSFMISVMLYVCSYPNRFDKMKVRHLSSKEEVASAAENFIRFTHAGFMAL
jgi:AcrR family transcriptional regulator